VSEKVLMKRVLVRMPEDVQKFLDSAAEKNCASRNSEIVRSIRSRMDTEQQRERAAG
jgi:metal-responsive CopG/Arc/MetJ family transcriptional regulator